MLLSWETGESTAQKVAAFFIKYIISGLLILSFFGTIPLISIHEEYVHQKLGQRFNAIMARRLQEERASQQQPAPAQPSAGAAASPAGIHLPNPLEAEVAALQDRIRKLESDKQELRELSQHRQELLVQAEGEIIDLKAQLRETATPETAKEFDADWGFKDTLDGSKADATKTPSHQASDTSVEALKLKLSAFEAEIERLKGIKQAPSTPGTDRTPRASVTGGASRSDSLSLSDLDSDSAPDTPSHSAATNAPTLTLDSPRGFGAELAKGDTVKTKPAPLHIPGDTT